MQLWLQRAIFVGQLLVPLPSLTFTFSTPKKKLAIAEAEVDSTWIHPSTCEKNYSASIELQKLVLIQVSLQWSLHMMELRL